MMKKSSNIVRNVFQGAVIVYVIFLVLTSLFSTSVVDFEAYCPFGGLQALGSFLSRGSLACTMSSTQITMGLILMIGMVLFGKLFCSYICPLGSLGEWFHKIGEKFKITIQINKLLDTFLRVLKYVLLFVVFYFTLDSSELFCKKFDPFFSLTTGFGHDVVLWMALVAIGLWIVGSVFIKMFFCKYLCPLGAITNIFRFFLVFAGIMLLYFVVLNLDVELSYVWPLVVSCVLGYILEITIKKRNIFPVFLKIHRNVERCIDCNLCTEVCPQGIDVANLLKVNHSDCSLCNDCLYACPVDNTLNLSGKRRKWLTPGLVILIVAIGVIIGRNYEIPTITETWGEKQEISEASVLYMEGLKDIKCFGSSMSFANKMRRIDGIKGVSTYVNSKSVKIWYDETVITEDNIKKEIFSSGKNILRRITSDVDSVQVIKIGLNKFIDAYDHSYLMHMLREQLDVSAMKTEYGCPVNLYLYYPNHVKVDPDRIKTVLETDELVVNNTKGSSTVDPGFEIVSVEMDFATLSLMDFALEFFKKLKFDFERKNINKDQLYCYITNGNYRGVSIREYYYLASYLEKVQSIYGFKNVMDSINTRIYFYYNQKELSENQLYKTLIDDSISVRYTNGSVSRVLNPFDFKDGGRSVKVDSLEIY